MPVQTQKRALSVLVVDDNEAMCENVKDILQSEGYQTHCVHDALTAIEHVKKSPPDIVLMDVRLPDMSGVNAFKEIKKIAPRVAVIMITGYSVDELIAEAMEAGARGYLKKPLDFHRLFALIEQEGSRPTKDNA